MVLLISGGARQGGGVYFQFSRNISRNIDFSNKDMQYKGGGGEFFTSRCWFKKMQKSSIGVWIFDYIF